VFYILFLHKKIDDLMLENPGTALDIFSNDTVGVIFSKDHPGRVKGLSYGAYCTLVFKKSTTGLSGMNYVFSSSPSPHVEDKVVKMETELATLKDQMNSLLAYIATRPDAPEHFAAMALGLVCASNTSIFILILILIYTCFYRI